MYAQNNLLEFEQIRLPPFLEQFLKLSKKEVCPKISYEVGLFQKSFAGATRPLMKKKARNSVKVASAQGFAKLKVHLPANRRSKSQRCVKPKTVDS